MKASYRPVVVCTTCGHRTRRLLRSRWLLMPCPACFSPHVKIRRSNSERAPDDRCVRIRVDIRLSCYRALQASGVQIGTVVREYLHRTVARGEV